MFSRSNSILLKIGGIGFVLGFVSWLAWAVLTALSIVDLFLFHEFFMSGIFFLSWSARVTYYGLLALSLLLSAVGGFALFRRYASWLGLVSGVGSAVTFVFSVSYLAFFLGTQTGFLNLRYFIYTMRFLPLSLFLSLILWAATLFTIGRKTSVDEVGRKHSEISNDENALARPRFIGLRQAAGVLFALSGIFGILLWQVILYWGIEIWLLMLGWAYAAGSLMAALSFLRSSRESQTPR